VKPIAKEHYFQDDIKSIFKLGKGFFLSTALGACLFETALPKSYFEISIKISVTSFFVM